jgi:rod shape-determining protein MreD
MLWSLALLALGAIEARFPWRGFWQDWVTAAGLLVVYLVVGAFIAGGQIEAWRVPLVAPQIALSILLFPLIARMVAFFDRVRLIRIRHVD